MMAMTIIISIRLNPGALSGSHLVGFDVGVESFSTLLPVLSKRDQNKLAALAGILEFLAPAVGGDLAVLHVAVRIGAAAVGGRFCKGVQPHVLVRIGAAVQVV